MNTSLEITHVWFQAQHRSARTGSWTTLEDTRVMAQLHGISNYSGSTPEEAEEQAKASCIILLKSKNRRSKYFRIVRVVESHQPVMELEI